MHVRECVCVCVWCVFKCILVWGYNAHYCTMHMWFSTWVRHRSQQELWVPLSTISLFWWRDSNKQQKSIKVAHNSYTLTHTTLLTCIHTHTSTQAHTSKHTLLHTSLPHMHTYSHKHTGRHTLTHTALLICIHTHTSTQAGTHSHTPLFSHAYILTQTHTLLHAHHTNPVADMSVIYYGIWLLYLLANFANWRKTHAQICRNYFVSWTTIFSLVK